MAHAWEAVCSHAAFAPPIPRPGRRAAWSANRIGKTVQSMAQRADAKMDARQRSARSRSARPAESTEVSGSASAGEAPPRSCAPFHAVCRVCGQDAAISGRGARVGAGRMGSGTCATRRCCESDGELSARAGSARSASHQNMTAEVLVGRGCVHQRAAGTDSGTHATQPAHFQNPRSTWREGRRELKLPPIGYWYSEHL